MLPASTNEEAADAGKVVLERILSLSPEDAAKALNGLGTLERAIALMYLRIQEQGLNPHVWDILRHWEKVNKGKIPLPIPRPSDEDETQPVAAVTVRCLNQIQTRSFQPPAVRSIAS